MLDLTVKVLIVGLTLAVGASFAFSPRRVLRRIDVWRGNASESAENSARMIWVRQIGFFLIGMTCFVIYLWVSRA